MSRPNWSRPLPRPLVIPKVMTLKTLADVRALMRHLPRHSRAARISPTGQSGGKGLSCTASGKSGNLGGERVGKTGTIVLLATGLAACGLVQSAQVSRMGPDQLVTVPDAALCNMYVQASPAVNAERQRRNLGDCSVAHRQCVQSGFQAGTANYLQCRQMAANAEAAKEAARTAANVALMQAGATMMASQPQPAPAPPPPLLLCTPNNTFGGVQAPSMTCR